MTGVCQWSGHRGLLDNLEECKLTGLPVENMHLDENMMLWRLASMLDGRRTGKRRTDLLARLRTFDPTRFGRAVEVCAYEAPAGDRLAVCVQVTEKRFLGLGSRTVYLGCVLRIDPVLKVIGNLVAGERIDNEWAATREPVTYR